MNNSIKYVAQLRHVRDVTLRGSADLTFWTNRLHSESLVPKEINGKAQILIVGADSKFKGLRFRELSFSVVVTPRPDDVAYPDAAFLIHAFNSRWSFAFCERVFFSTPYDHGDVHLNATPPSVQLRMRGQLVFHVAMQNAMREPTNAGEDGFEGPVYLPPARSGQQKKFYAKTRGATNAYSFARDEDALTIASSKTDDVFHALLESHFQVDRWVVRADAEHCKSKTYKG